MPRSRVLAGFGVATIVVVAAHATFLPRKIHTTDAENYLRYATDLRVDAKSRTGFISGVHGAVLVRATNTGVAPRNERTDSRAQDLCTFMASELRRIPAKFAAEGTFYLALLVYAFFLAPRLRHRLGHLRSRPLWWAGALIPGGVFFVLAAAPLLIWGYGYGGFTNLVGPNAMSYSGPYFHLRSWLNNSSNSISYRAFVSPLTLPAGVLVELGWSALRHVPIYGPLLSSEPESVLPYWIAGAIFYGLVAVGPRSIRRSPVKAPPSI